MVNPASHTKFLTDSHFCAGDLTVVATDPKTASATIRKDLEDVASHRVMSCKFMVP